MATPTYNAAGSGHTYDAGATTYTLAFSAAAGSNRILEVWVANGGAPGAAAPTGVTWGGQALTARGSQANGSTAFRQTKWYILEANFPSGATGNIVATWSGSQAYRGLAAMTHADVSQTAPFRNASVTAQNDVNEYTPDLAVSSATGDVVTAGIFIGVDAAGATGVSVTAGTERTETSIISGAVFQGAATVAGASTATIEWTRTGGAAASAGMMLGESLMGPVLASPTVGTLRYVGQTPTVSQGSAPVIVTPSVGTLRYVGQTPTVTSPVVVAPSAGTLRISGNTPTLPVSGGARTALIFPSNGASPVRFRFSGTGNYPDIMPLTLLWRYYPIQQTGYYVTFFHSRTDGSFVGDQTYFGCHPYPQGGGSGTTHNWEISIEGMDDITDENANSTVVTKAAWYSQAASTRSNGGGQSIVDYYWDLATASTRRISHLTVDGQLTNAANDPGITFGCASWNNDENLSGRLRGLQIYTSQLSEADIEALSDCEYDAEVVAVCAARSITSLWYLNCNPTPDDITDKSGNGNDPAWVGAARPTLWLEVLPTSGALRFDGQQPTVSTTSSAAVTPSVGTLRVVGAAPTVAYTDHVSVAPSVGSYRFTGQQPTASFTAHVAVAPSVGLYRFDGAAPSIAYTDHVTVTPSAGTYRFDGQQPSVTSTAAQTVTPSVGTVQFAGQQPTTTVSEPGLVSPFVGTLRFDGQQPSVGYTHSVDPLQAVLRIEGAYPTVTVTANDWAAPSTGTVRVDGGQPTTTLTANLWAAPAAGELRFDGLQPTLIETGDKTTAPQSGVIRFVGNAPVASLPRERVGGDDLPPGWSKRRARLKLNRELEYTEQIREIYRQLTGSPQAAEAEAILAPVVPPVAATGESEDARFAAIEARAEALRVRADRLEPDAVQAEIALRLLYQQWRQQMEDDDVAAIEILLAEVL